MEKNIAIEFNNVGKQYRLGLVGTGSLQHDLNRWWQTTILGKEDPYLKIGEVNDRSKKGSSDYVWALKDISFKVEQGDVVGIIGKNGAGKSTLLKLLSHITAPTTGDIRYRGRIASLLEVGTGFHPEMTARQNIYMNGSIMGMTRHEITSKLDEIVDFAGIERYLDTPVKRFSSGMTVRLGFAVAAFLEPEILVVDEVLAVGDAEFQKKAIGKMKDVSSSGGRTVLFVSHNMAAVRSLCNNGIVLKNGMINYTGTADDAVDHYLQAYADDYSNMSIADMPRHEKTNGSLKIIGIEYLNNHNELSTPHCGQPMRIRLKLDVREKVESCYVSIGIRNMLGDPIMTFPSDITMDDFDLTAGIHYATLNIPKLPLTGGQYRIGVWCSTKNLLSNIDCADYLDNIIKLDVEEDDFFTRGKRIAPHLCGKVVLCEHNWIIE